MSRALPPRPPAALMAACITRGAVSPATWTPSAPWAAALVVAMLGLVGCSGGSMDGMGAIGRAGDSAVGPSGASAEGRTDLETRQACRQRVNEMYEIRNRSEIYAANPSENTPSSANSQVGVPSRGLSSQFAYDQSVADCVRNAGTGAERVDMPPPSPKGR